MNIARTDHSDSLGFNQTRSDSLRVIWTRSD